MKLLSLSIILFLLFISVNAEKSEQCKKIIKYENCLNSTLPCVWGKKSNICIKYSCNNTDESQSSSFDIPINIDEKCDNKNTKKSPYLYLLFLIFIPPCNCYFYLRYKNLFQNQKKK